MRKVCRHLAIPLFAVAVAVPASAQNIEAGYRVALRCSGCHEIGNIPVQTIVSPSFESIARMPNTTEMSLQVFLSAPHPPMPDYILSQQEVADVSAYILSLK